MKMRFESHIFKSVREVEKREDIFQKLCNVENSLPMEDFVEAAKQYPTACRGD